MLWIYPSLCKPPNCCYFTFLHQGIPIILPLRSSLVYPHIHYLATLFWQISGKESACQCRRHMFNHGQRSLVGYSPWSHKKVRHDLMTKQQPFLVACAKFLRPVKISQRGLLCRKGQPQTQLWWLTRFQSKNSGVFQNPIFDLKVLRKISLKSSDHKINAV